MGHLKVTNVTLADPYHRQCHHPVSVCHHPVSRAVTLWTRGWQSSWPHTVNTFWLWVRPVVRSSRTDCSRSRYPDHVQSTTSRPSRVLPVDQGRRPGVCLPLTVNRLSSGQAPAEAAGG